MGFFDLFKKKKNQELDVQTPEQTIESAEQERVRDLATLERPHGDIDDRTNDIAALIFKSLPEAVPTPVRCAMLDDIYALRDDLRTHSNIELFLLRPLVDGIIKNE
jgi:hypothetical protein